MLGSALFLLGVLALLWREDWRIGAVLTAFALGALLYLTRGGSFVARRSQESRVVTADLSSYLEERLSALPDIKANGADDVTMLGLHQRLAARFHVDRRSYLASGLFFSGAGTALVIATVASLSIAAWLHGRAEMTLGGVYLVFRYTGMLRHLESLGEERRKRSLADRVFTETVNSFNHHLNHVGTGRGVHDISLALERGSFTVVTGRVGSGKSTLLHALLGLLPLDRGEIRWNGEVVDDPATFFVPPRTAFTPQVPRLFSDTLRENLLLGRPPAEEAVVGAAVRAAVLDRDVETLDAGLDTVVGRRGVKLSGGQVQRAAAARMFLRGADLLVFDDLSSALDVDTETELWRRLLDRRGEVTCLVVSHSAIAMANADRVVVLDDGRVVT